MRHVESEPACPPPGRFWEVALGARWSPDEQAHFTLCPRCRAAERRVLGTVAGDEGSATGPDLASDVRPASDDPISVVSDPDMVRRFQSGGSSAWTPDPQDATDEGSRGTHSAGPRWIGPPGDDPSGTPRILGRYELLREIGRGGMGVVYQGRDVELDRIVALKVSPSLGPADGPRLDRFLREARTAARLSHPAILPIYEVGQSGSTLYIVSPFVDGTDLASLVRRRDGSPSCRDAASLIEQVARGVHHAHERGILHRDIKPSNILLDRTGHPFLADFGLARALDGDHEATITREGVIMGTPAYMAPEQATGPLGRLGPTTDVYSLGATLYTLLTGLPTFRAPGAFEHLRQLVETDPVPPRRINPEVPSDLDAICLKALARDPSDRYPTAEALADDLRHFLAGRAIARRRIDPARRMLRSARLRPRLAILAIAAVAIALSSLGLAAILQMSPTSSRLRPLARDRIADARAWERPGIILPLAGRVEGDSPGTPTEAELIARLENMAELRRTLAASAVTSCLRTFEELDRRRDEQPDDPEARLALARASLTLGHVYGITSRPSEAAHAYRRAVALVSTLHEQYPSRQIYRIELAEAHRSLAAILRATGQTAEATEFERRASALMPATHPPDRATRAPPGPVGP